MRIYNKKMFYNKDFEVEDGSLFDRCNLAQKDWHTVIFDGARHLKFVNCNLSNVEINEDWDLVDCFTPPHVEYVEPIILTPEEQEEEFETQEVEDILERLKEKSELSKSRVKKIVKEKYSKKDLNDIGLDFKKEDE